MLGAFLWSLCYYPQFYLPEDAQFYLARLKGHLPNRIYDRNDKLIAELFTIKSSQLKSEQIPAHIKHSFVFIEDQHFYEHNALHWPSIARAAWQNLKHLGYVQGGSSISQQLARLLLLEKQKTLPRKLREAALAVYT